MSPPLTPRLKNKLLKLNAVATELRAQATEIDRVISPHGLDYWLLAMRDDLQNMAERLNKHVEPHTSQLFGDNDA